MSMTATKPVVVSRITHLAAIGITISAALNLAACTAQAEVKTDAAPASHVVAPMAEKTVSVKDDSTVKEYSLKNGMKIIVKPDHRAPVVVSQVWYKTGSSYEINGVTGVAHVLEHMMFKGTKAHGPNEFSRIIAANGGEENAFTSQDYTTYFQQLEKSRLPISMQLEADRMENLNLRAEDFAKEIQVVMEERRMRTDDKPNSQTYEQFIATAYVNSPYHHPTLGWMTDLKHMTVNDARNWYNHWYAPNNATLVVVGDVDPDAVYAMAKKYYGPVKPKDVPTVRPQKEVPQHGMRIVHVKAPAQLPYLLMGYKVPVVKTDSEAWEPYALEMLAYVLDGGDSARFSKELVRGSQVATNIDAGYDLYSRLGELFTIDGTPSQGHSIKDLEQAVRAQIKRVQDEPVSEAELDRFKTQIVASKVYEKDSMFYQAMQIGTLTTVGLDWHLMDQYVDKVRAVTPAQIQAVARKYLVDDGLTVGILDPQKIPAQAARITNGGTHAQFIN